MTDSKNKHVLFVDDEKNILSGIRRSLRAQRQVWDMSFAQGGEEAIEVLRSAQVDLIVSDMRMPETDGSELLHWVAANQPHVIRMVLSGQCHKSKLLKIVNNAHQFLTKPSDAEHLIEKIDLAFKTLENSGKQNVHNAVASVGTIPSPASAISRLQQVQLDDDNAESQLKDICVKDIGISSKLLQLCSSSFFGTPLSHVSIEDAYAALGADTICNLIEAGVFVANHQRSDRIEQFLEMINEHSQRVAKRSVQLLHDSEVEANGLTKGMTYAGGMLHSIGRLIFVSYWGEAYLDATQAASDHQDLLDAEMEEFGTTHQILGSNLLRLWYIDLPLNEIAKASSSSSFPEQKTDNESVFQVSGRQITEQVCPFLRQAIEQESFA
ncbi:MAG: HDOD domain-containing protein [Planctomycetota bacterium]